MIENFQWKGSWSIFVDFWALWIVEYAIIQMLCACTYTDSSTIDAYIQMEV